MSRLDGLKAVLLTPSRVMVLLVAVGSLVVAVMVPDAATRGGWIGMSQLAGGAAILTVILGWRRFWRGPAVRRSYQRMMLRRSDRLLDATTPPG